MIAQLRFVVALAALIVCSACATLGPLAQLIQPPRFVQSPGRSAEIRFAGPSVSNPLGGAGVTVWVDVTNPNPFGFTLSTLSTTLLLEGTRAATGEFPLGLPLQAGETTTVPIDLSLSFSDLPGLANVVRRVTSGGAVAYQLDGTVGVDAGRFGQPTFGPMRLTSGEISATR